VLYDFILSLDVGFEKTRYRRCEMDVGERVENTCFSVKYRQSKLRVVLVD